MKRNNSAISPFCKASKLSERVSFRFEISIQTWYHQKIFSLGLASQMTLKYISTNFTCQHVTFVNGSYQNMNLGFTVYL